MELVATSKLKRAKDLNIKITPYKNEVFEIISYCVKNIQEKDYKRLKYSYIIYNCYKRPCIFDIYSCSSAGKKCE